MLQLQGDFYAFPSLRAISSAFRDETPQGDNKWDVQPEQEQVSARGNPACVNRFPPGNGANMQQKRDLALLQQHSNELVERMIAMMLLF